LYSKDAHNIRALVVAINASYHAGMQKRPYTTILFALAIVLLLVLLLAWLINNPATENEEVISGTTMGTTYSIRVSDCATIDCEPLTSLVQNRLIKLEQRLSHYDQESELSAFNNYHGDDWFAVSADLQAVVSHALELSKASNGAFDITVAPAVNAWGFGPQLATVSPDEQTINKTLASIGFNKLSTRANPPALRKTTGTVTLNLSALAKGYAVDQLALMLEAQGATNYLVEIGGEVRTAGLNAAGRVWRIGIEPPDGGLDIEFIIAPGDEAVATSGDYRNFFIEEGKRYSHTIDPASARPVDNQLASVSVVAPSAMQADALATLFMVLGAEASYAKAQTDNIPVLIISRDKDGISTLSSDALQRYLLEK
jgi:thiamine biosynthesis lipoprotein